MLKSESLPKKTKPTNMLFSLMLFVCLFVISLHKLKYAYTDSYEEELTVMLTETANGGVIGNSRSYLPANELFSLLKCKNFDRRENYIC